jgi:hypothetical protein
MSTSPNFKSDFYMTRLTDRDLKYTAAIASQALYTSTMAGHSPELWQFVFDASVTEMRRRTDAAEGRFVEPEPLPIPNWAGRRLGNAIMSAGNLSYLPLSPGVAALADWLTWSLTIQAITVLTHYEDRLNEHAKR